MQTVLSSTVTEHCGAGESPGLRAVSFVRCFQMTPESLDAALAAAASEASSLRMVAFSHLDLAAWREKQEFILPQGSANHGNNDYGLSLVARRTVQAPAAGSLQVDPPGGRETPSCTLFPKVTKHASCCDLGESNLRYGTRLNKWLMSERVLVSWCHPLKCSVSLQVLSLHNCTKLRSTALSAIAGGCPQLRMLMLGGCSLALTPSSGSSPGVAKVTPLPLSAVKSPDCACPHHCCSAGTIA